MIDFTNKSYLKLKEVDDSSFSDLIGGILVPGEKVFRTYRSVRDGVVFTDKRVITINIQGMTGKKKDITVLPYSRVQAFSIESAGVIDLDSELCLWFSNIGQVMFEFTSRTDVSGICRHISQCMLG